MRRIVALGIIAFSLAGIAAVLVGLIIMDPVLMSLIFGVSAFLGAMWWAYSVLDEDL